MENVQNVLVQQAALQQQTPRSTTGKSEGRFEKAMADLQKENSCPKIELKAEDPEVAMLQMRELAAMQILQANMLLPQNGELTEQNVPEISVGIQNPVLQNTEINFLQHETSANRMPVPAEPVVQQKDVQIAHGILESEKNVQSARQPINQADASEKNTIEISDSVQIFNEKTETSNTAMEAKSLNILRSKIPALQENRRAVPEEVKILTDSGENPVFTRVDTTPVKVSEVPAEIHHSQNVEKQVMDGLTEIFKSGEHRIELQLNPQNLGKIKIELIQKQDGSLHVALQAEHSEVRSMLEQGIPEMQQMLKDSIQQEVQIHLPEQQEEQQFLFGEQQERHQHNQQEQEKRNPRHREDFLGKLRLGLSAS